MPSAVPDNHADAVAFCELHVGPWEEHAAAIGVDPGVVAELADLTAAAAAAQEAARAARLAAQAATVAYYAAVESMRTRASGLVRSIRTHAVNSGDEQVYALARLDPPRKPQPGALPAPGTPGRIDSTLNPDGSLTLRFRAKDAAASTGASFAVERRLEGEARYTSVGVAPGSGALAGTREIESVDRTIPAGTRSASYVVTPRRGRKVGEAGAAFTVNFSSTPGRAGEGGRIEAKGMTEARRARSAA
jgi:hypothetical protein